jgi:hypothetical protein
MKVIRLFDKNNKTLAYMQFKFDATLDQINDCIESLSPFYEDLAGQETLPKGHFKTAYDAMREVNSNER